jgi:hypothetical protein
MRFLVQTEQKKEKGKHRINENYLNDSLLYNAAGKKRRVKMNYSVLNHKRATLGIISFAVLMLSLLSLVLLVPIANASTAGDTTTLPTPTPPWVGGEFVPANILQLLTPYLIIAALGVVAVVALVLYKKIAS